MSIGQTSVKFNQNTKFFIHENASENIICQMAVAILSRGDELTFFAKYTTGATTGHSEMMICCHSEQSAEISEL